MAKANAVNEAQVKIGRVVQCIGAVVDVNFHAIKCQKCLMH